MIESSFAVLYYLKHKKGGAKGNDGIQYVYLRITVEGRCIIISYFGYKIPFMVIICTVLNNIFSFLVKYCQ